MPRNTAQERAQKNLDRVDERIAALEERKQRALSKVEQQYADDLASLRAEREHAAAHPALQPVAETPGDTDGE